MKQELKDKEVILCAAIHYDNGLEYPHQSIYGVKTGFVLCGYRHPNIIGILPTNIYFKKTNENSVQVAWNENCPKHESYQGFLTSTGRFVKYVMILIIVISFIIIGVYVIINISDEGPDLKDFIYFLLIVFGVFLGGIIEDYKQESQNNFKSKIDYIKNSEVLNSIDTLVTYRDSVLLIFK